MSELELRLNRLGQALDVPETPDLTGPVSRRLAEGRRPGFAWRRPALIALAALLVAVGALMAVPQSRSAILDFFGIGSVTIRVVDEYPELDLDPARRFYGDRMSLEEARRRAAFPVRVPQVDGLGDPKAYFLEDVHQVSLVYGDPKKPRLLISQIIGTGAIEKLVNSDLTDIEQVREGDSFGVWLEGEHVIHIPQLDEMLRVVGNTLVMEATDNVTTRVEADIPKAEALRIFRSMR
jgi:hypothetical protein